MKLLFYVFWTLDVSRTASYQITHVRLVICLSVRPSVTKFSQVWIISFFSDIAHDDRWPWYLVTDEAIFFNKKIRGLNQAQNEVFRDFVEFESLVVLVIAYSDSLQQCLISSRGKTHEKNWEPKFGLNEPKSGPKLSFSPLFQVCFMSFLKLQRMLAWNNVWPLAEIKFTKTILRDPKLDPEIRFFCYFLKVASLVFLDIAQDCSLGQFPTSCRAQIGKKWVFPDARGRPVKPVFCVLNRHLLVQSQQWKHLNNLKSVRS